MGTDQFFLELSNTYNGKYVLSLERNHNFTNKTYISHIFNAKHAWLDWLDTFTFKGTIERQMGRKDFRNKVVFSELSDAMMVKLAFDSKQFEGLE